MCNNENKSTANKTSMYWLNSAICKVAQWCWIIPEPESGAWVEPLLPSCFCQESSVLQNTTVDDLSLVCNEGRCISYSLSPFCRAAFLWAVSQDYWHSPLVVENTGRLGSALFVCLATQNKFRFIFVYPKIRSFEWVKAQSHKCSRFCLPQTCRSSVYSAGRTV